MWKTFNDDEGNSHLDEKRKKKNKYFETNLCLQKGIQRQTKEQEKALTAEKFCKVAGCRQRILKMTKEKRRKKINESCNYDSNQRHGWSSLKAAVNHSDISAVQQPLLILLWMIHL